MNTIEPPFDANKFINTHQVGGIELCTLENGVRAAWVNTGGGLRYRVLIDRGLDIDQAFHNVSSLGFLTHRGAVAPSQGYNRGAEWLKSFPGGLLTSCGPLSAGAPAQDGADILPLHGTHSNTPAEVESVVQPDARGGRLSMSVSGVLRYGAFYGPCVELRRTISSTLGRNTVDVADEFFNAGNANAPHAWLLHINFGYPLLDGGAEFCYDSKRVEPRDDEQSRQMFAAGRNVKRVSDPSADHMGDRHGFAYLYPRARGRSGQTTVGLANRKLPLAVAIHYNVNDFPRCGNWQHWGQYEYVAALEPMTGGVEGRDKDRQRGWLRTLSPGERRAYRYQFEVITDKAAIEQLRQLNR